MKAQVNRNLPGVGTLQSQLTLSDGDCPCWEQAVLEVRVACGVGTGLPAMGLGRVPAPGTRVLLLGSGSSTGPRGFA